MNNIAAKFKLKTLLVNFDALEKLKLTLNEYVLAGAIMHLSSNPDSIAPGWLYLDSKLVTPLGKSTKLSRATTYRTLKSLRAKGIIEFNPEAKNFVRTTQKWYEEVVGIMSYPETDRLKMRQIVSNFSKEKVVPKENIYNIKLTKVSLQDKPVARSKISLKCTNPEGHEACKGVLLDLEKEFGKKFTDWGVQLKYLHSIYKAKFTDQNIERTCNELDEDPYWKNEGWDLITIAKKLSKGGRYVR